MKKISALLFAYLISHAVFSQKMIVDDLLNLKKGIYKTFDEFKENTPSIPFEYEVIKVNELAYQLKIDQEKTNFYGSIWGFCDGKTVYINLDFDMSGRNRFRPHSFFGILQNIGRYCYFQFPQVAYTNINAMIVHGRKPLPYVVDFNSGKLLCLNCDMNAGFIKQSHFKKILTRDPELWTTYKNDTSDEDLFYKYITIFCDKYSDEIVK